MKGEIHVDVEVSKSSRLIPINEAVFQPAAFAGDDRIVSRLHIQIDGHVYVIEWDPRTPVL